MLFRSHLAPGFLPQENSAGIATGHGLRMTVATAGGDAGASGMHWEEYPYSAAYGDVQPAFMLRVRRNVRLPWSGRTTLQVMPCAA